MPVINPLVIAPFAGDPAAGLDDVLTDSDRRAIERLVFAYSYHWDSRHPDGTAALFTEDAEVAFFTDGATEPKNLTVGRDKLLKGMTSRTEMLKRWRIETRHLMTMTTFAPVSAVAAGDDALVELVTTAVIYWQQLPEHPAPIAVQTGYYKSWCIETDAGWRFRRREAHLAGVNHPRDVFPEKSSSE